MSVINKRSYPLDFLKIVATIIIVLHHFQQNVNVVYDHSPNFWGSWFYWGYMVELFFLLSGYFMFKYIPKLQNEEITLAGWFSMRAKRLLPMVAITAIAYEVSILIYFLITGTNWPYFGEVSIWGTLITMLGIQEGWGLNNPGVNNPVWYVSVLLVCYVWFYIICALSKKLKCSPIYFFIGMIFLGFGIQTFGINLPFLTSQLGRGYYSFFFGLLLAAFLDKHGIGKRLCITATAVFISMVVLFVFFSQHAQKEPLVYLLTFLFFPSIVVLLETDFAKKIFSHEIWGTLGNVTFSVYLWHSPMFPLMYGFLALCKITPDFSAKWTMYAFLAAACAIGAFSYFFIECPINRLIKKHSDKQKN